MIKMVKTFLDPQEGNPKVASKLERQDRAKMDKKRGIRPGQIM